MFTGITTDLGHVSAILRRGDTLFTFETAYEAENIAIGASICCSGACLTVIDKEKGKFSASVSQETLSKTTLGLWQEGTPVNFERALKVGDELGGHIVSGHVDGVAKLERTASEGDSMRYTFQTPPHLQKFVASKGSLALDGVSLTVNETEGDLFGVNLIPHTLEVTTLGKLSPGDGVNLEIDMLARYVARLLEKE
jgi:riboflavin synthase